MSQRVALVHDWLTGYRGGERVLAALCDLYPDADLFTLVHEPGSAGAAIESHSIQTSFLQRLPGARRRWRHFLPLFPLAIERLDLSGYDLVVSTSHAVAKGCRPASGAVHVSYVHTPMRYIWDQFDAYFGPGRAGPVTRLAARAVAPALRAWDVASTARVDGLIANSRFVSDRCLRCWGRAADAVVYPPVETDRFQPAPDLTDEERSPRGTALLLSALVPYKRVDLAVRAFSRAGRRLVVAGGGPELARLRQLAGPTVQLLGPVSAEALPRLLARCSFFLLPGEEDFGIAPLEAQAAGRPVLALGRGGALETVRAAGFAAAEPGPPTGCFFSEPTVESLVDSLPAIDRLARESDPAATRTWARRFDAGRFGPELAAELARLIGRARGGATGLGPREEAGASIGRSTERAPGGPS